MKNRDINSVEIARLAGVSRSTVSRVINNYPNVPLETKEKVMKVIRQYNYVPHISAQILAGKSTRTLGLFLIEAGEVSSDILTNILIVSVIERASRFGYYVLTNIIRNTQDADSIRNVKEIFFQRRIDAGIFIGAANHEPIIEELIAEGFVVGILDQDLPGRNEPNRLVVNFENQFSIEKAVDYLVSNHHRKIGMINGDFKRLAGPAKFEGYKKAMERHRLPIHEAWVLPGNFNEASGHKAIVRLLKEGDDLPTAIIAANDSIAFGAIRALQERSIRVPEDISVIGCDDHMLSAKFQPALTTLRVDVKDMMERLTSMVVETLEEGPLEERRITLPSELIVRDSCKSIQ